MSSLRRDALLLGLIHLANHLLPLVVLPWLTSRLGPEGYGRYSFVIAVTWYFVLLADYGFNLTATREVALVRDERNARSRVFWSTLATKAVLALAGAFLLWVLAAALPVLRAEGPALFVAFLLVIGSVLTPVWYFQGTERLPALAGLSFVVGVASVPLTFALVTSPGDMLLALAIPGLASVLTGASCVAWLVARKDLMPPDFRLADIKGNLLGGCLVFVSTAGVSLYTNTNTVVVGLVAGPSAAGLFAVADKVVRGLHGLLTPISRVAFPRLAYQMSRDPAEAYELLRRLLRVQAWASSLLAAVLFVSAPWVVNLLFGSEYAPATSVLRIMAPLLFIVAMSNVFGLQTMLPLGLQRQFSSLLLAAGVLNVVLILPLTAIMAHTGAAIALLVTETVVTLAMLVLLLRRRVPLFKPGH